MEDIKVLEKLDKITERTHCSYKEAQEALDKCNGDIVQAIIYLEDEYEDIEIFDDFDDFFDDFDKTSKFGQKKDAFKQKFEEKFEKDKIMQSLKDLLAKANATRITVFDKSGKTLVDIPVTAGAIGSIFFIQATLIGVVAALAVGCTLRIVRENGEEININEFSKEQFDKVKQSIDKFGKKSKDASQNDYDCDWEDEDEDEEDYDGGSYFSTASDEEKETTNNVENSFTVEDEEELDNY